jgi:hypothetical protein
MYTLLYSYIATISALRLHEGRNNKLIRNIAGNRHDYVRSVTGSPATAEF